jgi:hypothetical protein
MEKGKNGITGIARKEEETALQKIAALVRKASEEGRLSPEAEILCEAAGRHLFPPTSPDSAEKARSLLKKTLAENEDLHGLAAPDGSRDYYSSEFMTEAYARILSLKRGGPRQLIAEIVRQNSAFYPRPVPIDTFTHPPFSLTTQDVLKELEEMRAEEGYRDIASTTTSSPRVFLYSALHLEPDHAAMLAEWLDVGQFENP